MLGLPRGYFFFYSRSSVDGSRAVFKGRCRFLCREVFQHRSISSVWTHCPSRRHSPELNSRNRCTQNVRSGIARWVVKKRRSASAPSTPAPLRIMLVASPRLKRTHSVDGRMHTVIPARWNTVLHTCPNNWCRCSPIREAAPRRYKQGIREEARACTNTIPHYQCWATQGLGPRPQQNVTVTRGN